MGAPSTRLRVRVVLGAGRPGLVGRYGAGWKLRVAAPAERGRANDALVGLLAETLGVTRPAVRLVGGAAGRDKIVELTGVSAEEADRRLEAAGAKARS